MNFEYPRRSIFEIEDMLEPSAESYIYTIKEKALYTTLMAI